ncbi:MAG: pyridoxal-phosphate dependent enzyme [bacterium]
MSFQLKCVKCNEIFPFSIDMQTCPHHNQKYGYLEIVYKCDSLINLPIKKPIIDLGQLKTPLIKAQKFGEFIGLNNLFVKDESKNPTGSFKDRENFIFFNFLLENKIHEPIFVVSSGNAAVSTSAYVNKSGFKCCCYLPSTTSESKKSMIKLYNGKIIESEGRYEDIYNKLISDPPEGINATPGICPLKEEGPKMIAYELFEQIGIPDKIVVHCGNGTNLWSIYRGFIEISKSKNIQKMPQMIGVQVSGGDPIYQALQKGEEFFIIENPKESVAEGIIAVESYSSFKAIKAIKETKGFMVTVLDKEIIETHKEIIFMESIVPELTSSSVFAALKKIKADKNEVVVCINTGSGLKDVKEFALGTHI